MEQSELQSEWLSLYRRLAGRTANLGFAVYAAIGLAAGVCLSAMLPK